jgi:double-stranded uracil-DNA glycosylase
VAPRVLADRPRRGAARSIGFAPLSTPSARVLILGSLPGEESLRRREYYAQPRNTFWRIIGDLFGIAPEQSYRARIGSLLANRIAVWDVCAAAIRPGSLDSAILTHSVQVNDFNGFFKRHPRIKLIGFNGSKAAALFRTRVFPQLTDASRMIATAVLPSTSPAHAALPYGDKRRAWEIIRGYQHAA